MEGQQASTQDQLDSSALTHKVDCMLRHSARKLIGSSPMAPLKRFARRQLREYWSGGFLLSTTMPQRSSAFKRLSLLHMNKLNVIWIRRHSRCRCMRRCMWPCFWGGRYILHFLENCSACLLQLSLALQAVPPDFRKRQHLSHSGSVDALFSLPHTASSCEVTRFALSVPRARPRPAGRVQVTRMYVWQRLRPRYTTPSHFV